MRRTRSSRYAIGARLRQPSRLPIWLQDILGLVGIIAVIWLLAALQTAAVWQDVGGR